MTTLSLNDVKAARAVRTVEHTIDDALVHGADYLARLINGRRQHNLAAEVGHDAIRASIEALSHLGSARDAQVRSHAALGQVAEAQGIGWHLAGPLEEKIKPPAAIAG